MKTKVTQMTSNRTGYEVANQMIINDGKGNTYFQSYRSIIAKVDKKGKVSLDSTYWDYSKTTSKYRNQFLGEKKEDTLKKIADKTYKLANLN